MLKSVHWPRPFQSRVLCLVSSSCRPCFIFMFKVMVAYTDVSPSADHFGKCMAHVCVQANVQPWVDSAIIVSKPNAGCHNSWELNSWPSKLLP